MKKLIKLLASITIVAGTVGAVAACSNPYDVVDNGNQVLMKYYKDKVTKEIATLTNQDVWNQIKNDPAKIEDKYQDITNALYLELLLQYNSITNADVKSEMTTLYNSASAAVDSQIRNKEAALKQSDGKNWKSKWDEQTKPYGGVDGYKYDLMKNEAVTLIPQHFITNSQYKFDNYTTEQIQSYANELWTWYTGNKTATTLPADIANQLWIVVEGYNNSDKGSSSLFHFSDSDLSNLKNPNSFYKDKVQPIFKNNTKNPFANRLTNGNVIQTTDNKFHDPGSTTASDIKYFKRSTTETQDGIMSSKQAMFFQKWFSSAMPVNVSDLLIKYPTTWYDTSRQSAFDGGVTSDALISNEAEQALVSKSKKVGNTKNTALNHLGYVLSKLSATANKAKSASDLKSKLYDEYVNLAGDSKVNDDSTAAGQNGILGLMTTTADSSKFSNEMKAVTYDTISAINGKKLNSGKITTKSEINTINIAPDDHDIYGGYTSADKQISNYIADQVNDTSNFQTFLDPISHKTNRNLIGILNFSGTDYTNFNNNTPLMPVYAGTDGIHILWIDGWNNLDGKLKTYNTNVSIKHQMDSVNKAYKSDYYFFNPYINTSASTTGTNNYYYCGAGDDGKCAQQNGKYVANMLQESLFFNQKSSSGLTATSSNYLDVMDAVKNYTAFKTGGGNDDTTWWNWIWDQSALSTIGASNLLFGSKPWIKFNKDAAKGPTLDTFVNLYNASAKTRELNWNDAIPNSINSINKAWLAMAGSAVPQTTFNTSDFTGLFNDNGTTSINDLWSFD